MGFENELQLLRGRDYVINQYISIRQPTLEEICSYGELEYYNMVLQLCATPSDYKVQLMDICGIDYETVGEFELFGSLCLSFPPETTSILFPNLNFQDFHLVESKETKQPVLYNFHDDTVIDKAIYQLMVTYLRTIHNLEHHVDIAGNENTKQYIMNKERRRQSRRGNQKFHSILAPLISALVNCEQFKYDHDSVWSLHLYTFFDSVKRIQKIKEYSHIMQGVYAGTIDMNKISNEEINWLKSFE